MLRDGDAERFFVRALLELPIDGEEGYFGYGSWIEVSPEDFEALGELWHDEDGWRSDPFAGTLANELHPYAFTEGLPVRLRLREVRLLPLVELDETDHELVRAQRNGISPIAPTSSPRRSPSSVSFDRPERVPLAERAGVEARVVAPGEVELVQDGAGGDARAAVDDEVRARPAGRREAATRPGSSGSWRPGCGPRPDRSAPSRRASAPAPWRRRASATRPRAAGGAPSASAVSSRASLRDERRRLDLLRVGGERAVPGVERDHRRRVVAEVAQEPPEPRRPAGAVVVADDERVRPDPGRGGPGCERVGARERVAPAADVAGEVALRIRVRGAGDVAARDTRPAGGSRRIGSAPGKPNVCMKSSYSE